MTPRDHLVDEVWAAVQRGDSAGAEASAQRLNDPILRERAMLDALSVSGGRVAALEAARSSGSSPWLAARFDASAERARERLAEHLRSNDRSAVGWFEWSRRAGEAADRRAGAWRADEVERGALEARLLALEADLLERRLEDADETLQELESLAPESARVRWARRRWQAALGQRHALAAGILDDIATGRAIAASLVTLGSAVTASVDDALTSSAIDTLLASDLVGRAWARERARLLAAFFAQRGEWRRAAAWLEQVDTPRPLELRQLDSWRLAAAGETAPVDPRTVATRRLAGAWRAFATTSYSDATTKDISRPLDDFVELVDRSAEQIPDAPRLAWLPRTSFGVVGEMLDTTPLRTPLPGAFVIGGKALGLPSDLAWYDELSMSTIPMPDRLDDADVYERHFVRDVRVPGVLVWGGQGITGAGLHRTVFLDVDGIARDVLRPASPSLGTPITPWPIDAAHVGDRFDLSEPLDVAERLRAAVRQDAGSLERYNELLVDEVAVHEEKHIADARDVLRGSLGAALGFVFEVGVLPTSVRPALERRAQLHALRHARDPRLALASMIDFLPVEGRRLDSEHAVGYRDVLTAFLDVLDREAWPDAPSLEELGLDRDHLLLHQLTRLDIDTMRAIALAIEG